jgi:hypothetical protein
LSSGTAMQLTPTVSSSSMSNYLSPNSGTSQFQFSNYNPTWYLDLTRQLKAKEIFDLLPEWIENSRRIGPYTIEECRTIIDHFSLQMLSNLDNATIINCVVNSNVPDYLQCLV